MKLIDEVGTHYLAQHTIGAVTALLNENDDIDIGGAKIARVVMNLINDAVRQGKNVYDSENAERNEILRISKERLKTPEVETTPLPILESVDKLTEAISSYDPNVIYSIGSESTLELALVLLTSIIRPEIKFNLDGHWFCYFNYVSDRVNYDIREWDTMLYLSGQSYIELHKNSNGKFHVVGKGYYSYRMLIKEFQVIPAVLGTKDLRSEEPWDQVMVFCVNDIQNYFRDRPKKLKEVL